MAQGNFTEDFRLDAIKRIKRCGHYVADLSNSLSRLSRFTALQSGSHSKI